ncbi:hypothetical protein [Streptomyces sp. NBC_01481]|uniref:hypothetical protein n=1 Tax=Streptomyces sp. NBC_01481 TaxID=2975869 RepID=UPI00225479D2|nr:hypothetical protein [Streptomyces sp. NBC_01481]MCX4586180.1 hypothetical protein [Streptomyces sp. NBC_01481]
MLPEPTVDVEFGGEGGHGPDDSFESRGLSLLGAIRAGGPAVLADADGDGVRDASLRQVGAPEAREDCGDRSGQLVGGNGTENVGEEVEAYIVQALQEACVGQGGKLGPEGVGWIKGRQGVEADRQIVAQSPGLLLGRDDPLDERVQDVGGAAVKDGKVGIGLLAYLERCQMRSACPDGFADEIQPPVQLAGRLAELQHEIEFASALEVGLRVGGRWRLLRFHRRGERAVGADRQCRGVVLQRVERVDDAVRQVW